VDGLVLAGYVAESIVARFSEFGIPCVGLGQDTELTGLVPTVAVDDVEGLILGVRHVYGLGHRQVLLHKSPRRRGREVVRQVKDRVKNDAILKDCQILVKEPSSGNCDFYSAPELFQFWRDLPADQRPTVIFASDQTLVCLLREMDKQGLQCPRDVSLISISDTLLCEYARPALTALNFDLADHGRIAVDLLVDHLEGKNNLDSSLSINDLPCTLVERESTKKISDL